MTTAVYPTLYPGFFFDHRPDPIQILRKPHDDGNISNFVSRFQPFVLYCNTHYKVISNFNRYTATHIQVSTPQKPTSIDTGGRG